MEEGEGEQVEESSDSDSDIDMLEALEKSPELQDHLRQIVRANLKEMAPSIFEKIKAELAIKDEERPSKEASPAEE